ncbi:hypothetical protein EVAR_48391_1 [Eumeta japonica]|uniref:Protein kinase domain-containing protein n=1 Tax=Eumeta variegata TaxID=151549 RepID=A0A4C1ZD61_EUMVA|nr:hypothetical protein EVAR_48391_1 [Eumeta japonica]
MPPPHSPDLAPSDFHVFRSLQNSSDFGLSNVWTAGGGLRTPCGSLEYAAPELLAPSAVRTRRYGPPLDLWSM